ncbi:uncharacterized protein SCHCODRAFT_02697067 [Schizophyllum commune H4-8]|uniref:uncharacterized protein n=1 Tax=Schizophyllum commune (strain H4-8 / FGSC 9210) TaxID=578458 RepID=UPI00215E4832|nr:uncharacterized protein SCHCODRAFT_02697067 [Schizophyllum commune H4-8]KAI5898529.1 hypothetical protein SCHCODRAFT_02697067 [Schizophyllum commune H4-8]
MRAAPTVTSRADVMLQPNYFTSNIYVTQLEEDLKNLVQVFEEERKAQPNASPFRVFREVWSAEGWPFLHYRVFDARSREVSLKTTLRIFLQDAIDAKKDLTERAVACFALFTFFETQPTDCSPRLLFVDRIPVAKDQYTTLVELPRLLTGTHQSLQPPTAFILANLVRQQVFHILPHSNLGPHNPRNLPREVYADSSTFVDLKEVAVQRKPGRPSKRDQSQRAKAGWQTLVTCLNRTTGPSVLSATSTHEEAMARPSGSSTQYHADKTALLRALDDDSDAMSLVAEASREALSRMEQIRDGAKASVQEGGLRRARDALQTSSGLLDLRRTASPTAST